MRISLKLTAAFLAIASLVGATGYIVQRTTVEVRTQIQRLKDSAVRRIVGAADTTAALYGIHLAAHRLLSEERRRARGDPDLSHPPGLEASIEAQRTEVEKGLEMLRSAAASRTQWEAAEATREATPRRPPALPLLLESWLTHQRLMDDVRRTVTEDPDRAERLFDEQLCRHFQYELLPLLRVQHERSEQDLTEAVNRVERSLAAADNQRWMLTAAAAASAVLIGLFMSRSIGRPLAVLQRAAQEVGRGHFDTRVAVGSRDEIGVLGQAVNQMAADLQEKTVSRSYLENIIQSMREMLIVTDADTKIRRLNPAACSELGCSPDDLVDRPLRELFATDTSPVDADFPRSLAAGAESVMRTPSQRLVPVLCSVAQMRDETGRLEGFVCVASNISRQKDTEQRLLASLREKELLLKEVHHRVKNNLQVISSLLNLQAQELHDPDMIRLFQESQGRVRSLALIHEQLYRSQDLSQIDLAAYVQELVERLAQGMGKTAARVGFGFELESSQLPLDLAIPCGMIVNELVSNALEHAFPEGRSGTVRIAFRGDEAGYHLTVADDGVGLEAGLLAGRPGTLGLKVVQALTRQIRGRLELQPGPGAVFAIHFAATPTAGSPLCAN
ncbi:MAG TPA: histidine kinase dimerization/phosphoacceptor domain -containing protein [Candidatus Anammoximicrobium sp.]|nr:histidine kinase dimerization/phosphoacceptor domain -containing protein [Candidatus Anammoximicrobium sp.]